MAHEPSQLGATRLLYPATYSILYSRLNKLSMLFSEDFFSGEFDEVIIAINGVGVAGELDQSEIMADSEG